MVLSVAQAMKQQMIELLNNEYNKTEASEIAD
jgi:hypothetical protein